MIGKERLHYHELRDGEEKHVHEGGDIPHEHDLHWGGRYLGQLPRSERLRINTTKNPYVSQDVGSEDYAAILEVARKITTENRWLKEQAEYLTWQLKEMVEQEKKHQEEIKKLRFYAGNNTVEDPA